MAQVKLPNATVVTDDPLEVMRLRLERVREEREREVRERGLLWKAQEVATVLGERRRDGGFDKYVFERGDMKIVFDDWVGLVHVFVNGNHVLAGDNQRVERYIPGPWVLKLERLYEEVERMKWLRETEDTIEELTHECERWGVDPQQLLDDLGV